MDLPMMPLISINRPGLSRQVPVSSQLPTQQSQSVGDALLRRGESRRPVRPGNERNGSAARLVNPFLFIFVPALQQSSICRAAIHSGAVDNNGGLVDITRKDNLPFFVKATKNEIESLRYSSVAGHYLTLNGSAGKE